MKQRKKPQCIGINFNGVEYPIKTGIEDLPEDIRKQMAQKLLKCQLKINQMDI